MEELRLEIWLEEMMKERYGVPFAGKRRSR
jgi:hypothetical protein